MEIWRYAEPDLDFISHIRKRCYEENIVLVLDEISSGFRLNTGGSTPSGEFNLIFVF